jgi:hypothetical protein
MSEKPGEQLDEEPQEERGPAGSRDTGSDEPEGGPVERPSETAEQDDDTGVEQQESLHPESPDLRSGGG